VNQLDLFHVNEAAQAPHCSKVLPFPLARRRRLVVRTANALSSRKTQEGREAYWSRTVDALSRELRRHGASEAEVHRQLSQFHATVSDEFISNPHHRSRPLGSA
jgi:hypothetical protein